MTDCTITEALPVEMVAQVIANITNADDLVSLSRTCTYFCDLLGSGSISVAREVSAKFQAGQYKYQNILPSIRTLFLDDNKIPQKIAEAVLRRAMNTQFLRYSGKITENLKLPKNITQFTLKTNTTCHNYVLPGTISIAHMKAKDVRIVHDMREIMLINSTNVRINCSSVNTLVTDAIGDYWHIENVHILLFPLADYNIGKLAAIKQCDTICIPEYTGGDVTNIAWPQGVTALYVHPLVSILITPPQGARMYVTAGKLPLEIGNISAILKSVYARSSTKFLLRTPIDGHIRLKPQPLAITFTGVHVTHVYRCTLGQLVSTTGLVFLVVEDQDVTEVLITTNFVSTYISIITELINLHLTESFPETWIRFCPPEIAAKAGDRKGDIPYVNNAELWDNIPGIARITLVTEGGKL